MSCLATRPQSCPCVIGPRVGDRTAGSGWACSWYVFRLEVDDVMLIVFALWDIYADLLQKMQRSCRGVKRIPCTYTCRSWALVTSQTLLLGIYNDSAVSSSV